MKNLFLSLILLLSLGLVGISCSDGTVDSERFATRDYETDVQTLSKFVDINKAEGSYYINESLKNSVLSYITDQDWKELQKVSPENRVRYEKELKELNTQLAIIQQRKDIGQIVYTTYGETWIKNIDEDTPVSAEIKISTETSDLSRASSVGNLTLWSGIGAQSTSFTANREINSLIYVEMYGQKYYFFEVVCQIDAYPTNPYGNNPKGIVISGTGNSVRYNCGWVASSSSAKVNWKFQGKMHAPGRDPSANIRIDFQTY